MLKPQRSWFLFFLLNLFRFTLFIFLLSFLLLGLSSSTFYHVCCSCVVRITRPVAPPSRRTTVATTCPRLRLPVCPCLRHFSPCLRHVSPSLVKQSVSVLSRCRRFSWTVTIVLRGHTSRRKYTQFYGY